MAERVYNEVRLSWSALFAGAIVAVVLELLLVSLGIGVGIGFGAGGARLTAGAGWWLGVSSIITLFAGGWLAGRLTPVYGNRNFLGAVDGLIVWGMTMIFSFMFLSVASTATLKDMTASVAPGTASTASIWTFIIMLLNAGSSAIGGITGIKSAPSYKVEEERERREFPRAA